MASVLDFQKIPEETIAAMNHFMKNAGCISLLSTADVTSKRAAGNEALAQSCISLLSTSE